MLTAARSARNARRRPVADQRADALVGEYFQQHRVGDGAVDDVRTGDAAVHGLERTADFRQHSTLDDAGFDQLRDLGAAESGQYLAVGVHEPRDIRQQDEFLRAQDLGDLSRDEVGVDVVGQALAIDADGCHDRNEIAREKHVQHRAVDAADLADVANVQNFRCAHFKGLARDRHLARLDQVTVLARYADRVPAMAVYVGDDFLVHRRAQHHFHDVHRLRVGNTHAFD